MDFNKVSFKDFEKVRLKATYNMKIGNREIVPGETIAYFDKLSISGLSTHSKVHAAKGGSTNGSYIIWEDMGDTELQFSNGVFSKEQFALLTNSKLIVQDEAPIKFTFSEDTESDQNGKIILKKTLAGDLFIYKKETGQKLAYTYAAADNSITIANTYTDVHIDYEYEYENACVQYTMGQEAFTGFVELEGITRIKDDESGGIVTGIVRIPRLRLLSNLSLRLGSNAQPIAANFRGIGTPVGSKGNLHSWEFYILSDDVNSDL